MECQTPALATRRVLSEVAAVRSIAEWSAASTAAKRHVQAAEVVGTGMVAVAVAAQEASVAAVAEGVEAEPAA